METVSFDAGWQTRVSGRNYASLSGIRGQLFKRHYLYVYGHVLYKSIFYISSMTSVACFPSQKIMWFIMILHINLFYTFCNTDLLICYNILI